MIKFYTEKDRINFEVGRDEQWDQALDALGPIGIAYADMLDYNGHIDFWVLDVFKYLLDHEKKQGEIFSYNECLDFGMCDSKDYYEFSFAWGMLVRMFGEYGTSPRSGWIEDIEGCKEFLKNILIEQNYIREV